MSRKISEFFRPPQSVSHPIRITNNLQIKTEPEVCFEINLDDVEGIKPTLPASMSSKSQQIQLKSAKYLNIQEDKTNKIPDNIKSKRKQNLRFNFPTKSHQNKSLQCGFCIQRYETCSQLVKHLKKDHGFGLASKFECDFDGKVFNKRSGILAHMKCHKLNVICKVCNLEMKFLSLKDHMLSVHSDERKFKCHLCSKSFKLPSVLKNHLMSHDKQFECKICGKKFRNGPDLKFHIKQFHENPRSFKCEICEKGFFDKGNFKKHLKTHDKNRDKAYKCDRCSYSDDNKAHLKKHQNFHARWDAKVGKDGVKCPKCSVMFKDEKHLSFHIAVVHPKVLFQCDLCAMYSKTKTNFEKHMRVVHLRNKKDNE
ncbi:unnamed protein product [Chironomus riparius]|uniref:C2H2-type domain-containing protein n=1 Tax=Chironomus riparius TaxID=315576 RepID=A0A9N9S9Q6_9DIPT|nr:unnamed protein product [Chironomus riparius]